MLPSLTNQYISYSMAVFSANEIRTLFYMIQLFDIYVQTIVQNMKQLFLQSCFMNFYKFYEVL